MDIRYQDINIRNANPDDSNQLAKRWNDGKVMAHAGFPLGLNTSAEKISKQLLNDSDEKKRTLIIEYKNLPIGEMNYKYQGDFVYDIGIKICEFQYQDKGLGRIILSLFIDQLFKMGARIITLDTNLVNKRAQHVYEKLGFKEKSISYNSYKDQLGKLNSVVYYELRKDDFCNLASKLNSKSR